MRGMSVKEALDLLKDYNVKLVAGEKGINNVITNVSVLEIPDIDEIWITGGEFLLTTLYSFKDITDIIKVITRFSHTKVAALGIHPGTNSGFHINQSIIDKANELGFPICLLPREIPYTTIFSVIFGNILNKQAVLLLKSEQINRYLTNILLEGGGINNIVKSLSNLLKKPVMMLDEFLKPVARSAYYEYGEDIYKYFDSGKLDYTINLLKNDKVNSDINYYKNAINFKVKIYDRIFNQVVQNVSFDNKNLGYILLWEDCEIDGHERNFDILGLTHAATAIALNEVKRRAVLETERKLKFEFYDDLLNQNYESEESQIRRANFLGLSIKGKHEVIIVDIDDFEQYYLKSYEKGEEHFQYIKNELNRIINFAVTMNNENSIVIPKSDSYIILLHINKNAQDTIIKQEISAITQYIQTEAKKRLPDITITIGVGNFHSSLLKLSRSYEEAKKAISIGRKVYGNGRTIFYSDLGIYSFLLFDDLQEFRMNCDKELEKIIQYEDKYNTQLLETLETYLDENESVVNTSKKLFVHVNTVKYRIARIKEIIGEEVFNSGESKLKIHLALKMRRISS